MFRSRQSSKLDPDQFQFLEFMKSRIEREGGSILLQHLTGHLSQLSGDIRKSVGTSKASVIKFIRDNPDIFAIDDKMFVSLAKPNDAPQSRRASRDTSAGSRSSDSSLPALIENGQAAIVRVFPEFAFAHATKPIKTSVYFTGEHFKDNKRKLLSDFKLYVGQMIGFTAKRSNPESQSKYCATNVWFLKNTSSDEPNLPNTRKTLETGLYDPMMLDGEGVIQNVFPAFGFITVDKDPKKNVYFYKSNVCKFENILDLTKILQKGDKVEFSAIRSVKRDSKARFEATKVWIKKQRNEKSDSCAASLSDVSENVDNRKSNNRIVDQTGKLCLRTDGTVIKFGTKYEELADADSCEYYVHGSVVTDIGWEFSSNDNVFFDAIKTASVPGWKATLVWLGEKPDVKPQITSEVFVDENLANAGRSTRRDRTVDRDTDKKVFYNSKTSQDIRKTLDESPVKEKRKFKSNSSLAKLDSLRDLSSGYATASEDKSDTITSEFDINGGTRDWGDSPFPDEDLVSEVICGDKKTTKVGSQKPDESSGGAQSFADIDDYEEEEFNDDQHPERLSFLSIFEGAAQDVDAMENTFKFLDMGDFKVDDNSNEETSKDSDDSSDSYLEEPSIKIFHNISGKVTHLIGKYVSVQCSELRKPATFYWTELYQNGVSIEANTECLNEILKKGDTIKLDVFEIVDDEKSFWQKVTLAWTGQKPKKKQMTPEMFIEDNSLKVTVTAPAKKKSLTSISFESSMSSPDRNGLSSPNSSDLPGSAEVYNSIYRSIGGAQSDGMSEQGNENRRLPELEMTPNLKVLAREVSQILQRRGFDQTVQLDMAATEVVKFLYGAFAFERSDASVNSLVPFRQIKDTKSTQTFVTGDVVSHNIYPH